MTEPIDNVFVAALALWQQGDASYTVTSVLIPQLLDQVDTSKQKLKDAHHRELALADKLCQQFIELSMNCKKLQAVQDENLGLWRELGEKSLEIATLSNRVDNLTRMVKGYQEELMQLKNTHE